MAYGLLSDRRRLSESGDAYTTQRNAVAAAMGALKPEDERKFIASLNPED